MPGLGIFKHNSVAVIGLAADNGKAIVVAKFQIFFIYLRHFFNRHDPLAVDDGNMQGIFQIFINRVFCNFRCQEGDYAFQKIIVVKNQGFIIQIMKALQVIELGAG